MVFLLVSQRSAQNVSAARPHRLILSFSVYLASILDIKFTTAGAHRETEKGEYGTLRFI